MKFPIVRTGPNHILIQGARRNSEQTRVVFRPSNIIGQPPALKLLLFLRIIRGQIRTDNGPILPIVRALM